MPDLAVRPDVATTTADTEPAAAPVGKGTLTGFPSVDQGALCAQPQNAELPGCFLDAVGRAELLRLLDGGLFTATNNLSFAIGQERVDILTGAKPEEAQALKLFLRGVLLAAGGSVFESAVTDSVEWAIARGIPGLAGKISARVAGPIAKAWLSQAVAKTRVEDAAWQTYGVNADGKDGEAEHAYGMQEQIKPMVDELQVSAPSMLTDAGLAAVAHGFRDMTAHSVRAYRDRVRERMDGFKRNMINDMGRMATRSRREGQEANVEEIHRGRLVWATGFGSRRLAVFTGAGEGQFKKFIEDDWVELALQMFRLRTGAEPEEVKLPETVSSGIRDESAWVARFLGGAQ